ncbi:MAG: aminoacyl-tRNA hydrolase [Phycisphaerales bacterium]|nr:aminoacyl-tRNA hydrolase [Phycisphaerales bacterium]
MAQTESWVPGIRLSGDIWTDRAELRFAFSRSSGPGGQNVNKVNSKTELRIRPEVIHGLSDAARQRLRVIAGRRINSAGEILIVSELARTQEANRAECLKRLKTLIGEALVVPKIRRRSKPTRAAKERRLAGKKHRGETKRLRTNRFE